MEPLHPIFDRPNPPNPNATGFIIPGLPRNPAPFGQPCPQVIQLEGKVNLSNHDSSTAAVQKWRLREMFEQVFSKIPDNAFIVGFDLNLLIDFENKPYQKQVAFGQLCDEQPTYPNLDMLRTLGGLPPEFSTPTYRHSSPTTQPTYQPNPPKQIKGEKE